MQFRPTWLLAGATAWRPLRAPDTVCSFARGSDLLQMGARVSEQAVVNVLGRWRTCDEWDTIGVARELDEVLDGRRSDYPVGLDVEATPRRREFCKNKGLVQRFVLNATVGLLPFPSSRALMAGSVGSSARELNAEPIDPRAVEVVFDALALSQSGIEDKDKVDARRASFETSDGRFDANAFDAALGVARRNVAVSFAIYPGVPNVIFLLTALKLDAFSAAADSAEDVLAVVRSNWEATGPASILLPLLPLSLVAFGALNPPRSSKAASESAAADRIFMETRVATRQKTETESPTSTPS